MVYKDDGKIGEVNGLSLEVTTALNGGEIIWQRLRNLNASEMDGDPKRPFVYELEDNCKFREESLIGGVVASMEDLDDHGIKDAALEEERI